MYPGQYPQPNPRRTVIDCPMISGYSTARLFAQALTTSQPVSALGVMATMVNQSNTTVKLSFVPLDTRQTPVLSGSGSRCSLYDSAGTSLGTSLYLSGYGQTRVMFNTTKPYLELFTESGGPSSIRVSLESLVQWDRAAFDKLDTKYPPLIIQPNWSNPV